MSTPTPTATHFAALAAAMESGDHKALVRTLGEMADEALLLAAKAPSREMWFLLGALQESLGHARTRILKASVR